MAAISITESEGEIVAHALDFDIVATGPDRMTALRRLDSLVEAHIRFITLEQGSWKDLVTPAPPEYYISPVDSQVGWGYSNLSGRSPIEFR